MSEAVPPAYGTLYLIPTLLGAAPIESSLSVGVIAHARALDVFVAESAKAARHFLKLIGHPRKLSDLRIDELNLNTADRALGSLLQPLLEGHCVGLLSEAGCPAVADPGSALVALAHRMGIRVVPLVGPSSLMLALMASGLEGQRFCFRGYLPVPRAERDRAIQAMEHDSLRDQATQICIEAPYRNERLLEAMLNVCRAGSRLCLATDLTLETETITTRRIDEWQRQARPSIDRRPTVFLLLA